MSIEISIEVAEQIAMFAFYADMSSTLDLKRRIIDTKKEYISDFATRFSGFLNGPLSSGLSAEMMLVPHKNKKKSGGDTTIIITSKELSKVAISKYKYPSLDDPQLNWDRTKKRSEKSLFTSQIERQQKYKGEFAVFHKFINNQVRNDPHSLSKGTASCLWHSDVMSFNQSHRTSPEALWNTQNLLEMFKEKPSTDIGSILKTVCLESVATPMKISNGIENFIRENKLPSRVLSINVLD